MMVNDLLRVKGEKLMKTKTNRYIGTHIHLYYINQQRYRYSSDLTILFSKKKSKSKSGLNLYFSFFFLLRVDIPPSLLSSSLLLFIVFFPNILFFSKVKFIELCKMLLDKIKECLKRCEKNQFFVCCCHSLVMFMNKKI